MSEPESTLKSPFDSFYEEFIYVSRYSKWLEEEGRRETWDETVDRYLTFVGSHVESLVKADHEIDIGVPYQELREAIYNLEVMPSMRLMMTAGKAAARDNTSAYNCAYLPVDDIKSFDEAMYILLC